MLELIMGFLNVALELTEMKFRFPRTKATFEKRCSVDELFFSGVTQYVDCLKCHTLYSIDQTQNERISRPNCRFATKTNMYNQVTERCDQPLYTVSKKNVYSPAAIYMYNSIVSTLRKFYLRDNFAAMVKAWKTRGLNDDKNLYDVYDGEVWKNFKIDENDEVPFVDQSDNNLMLSIGVDWYQNYTYSVHSTGAIYLTILNLPKEMRDSKDFVILSGLMPGPRESKLDEINNYLAPLVEELKDLMNGVEMMLPNRSKITVKAALTLVVADLPAAAKLCGFALYNGICACRKCERQFSAVVEGAAPRDYSGWEDETWTPRTKASNLTHALEWKAAPNTAQKTALVQKHGTRWSQLHLLEYFNPVDFTVIDPMHNLYLGTCKRIMVNMWIPDKDIVLADRERMSSLCGRIILPFGYDHGSIARKMLVGDGFGHMKGSEWLVFSVWLSPVLLKGILSSVKYDNWMLYVKALQLLSSTSVSLVDLNAAHVLLREFCKGFTIIYGKERLYPNIHMHLHIKNDAFLFGPLPSHSAFFYERCNKELKNIKTNSKPLFERTVMKSFLKSVHYADMVKSFPTLDKGDDLDTKIKNLFIGNDIHGTQKYYTDIILKGEIEESSNDFNFPEFISFSENVNTSIYKDATGYEPLPVSTIKSLKFSIHQAKMTGFHFHHLINHYRAYFVEFDLALTSSNYSFGQPSDRIQNKINKFKSIKILGNKYNSNESSSARGSFIRAYFDNQLRPAQIQYFFRHTIALESNDDKLQDFTFTFAFVRFYKLQQIRLTTYESINTEVCQNTFEDESEFCILPVSKIHSPIGILLNIFDNTNIVINIPKKITE